MKSILKLFLAFIVTPLLLVGCNDNDIEQITKASDLRLSDPGINTVILKENNQSENAFLIAWDDYSSGEGEFTIQLSNDERFENPVTLGTTTESYFIYSMGNLNEKLLDLGYTPESAAAVYIRIAKGETVSNSINFMVTPFPSKALFIVGNIQNYYGINDWTPTEALELRYIGDKTTNVFEGYVKLTPNAEFKFINKQVDWNKIDGDYGYDEDGKLKEKGGNIKPNAEEGLYYIKVDIDNMTYQLAKMNWGIIGNATPSGWDNETEMVYYFESNQFKYDGHLNAGEMKFRAGSAGQAINNNPWSFNVGDGDTAWDNADGNIKTEDKDYNITLAIDVKGNVTKTGF